MNRSLLLGAAFASLAIVGCSTLPEHNSRLDEARSAYDAARANSQVVRYAPIELRQASDAYAAAEYAWSDGAGPARVDQLAYLAKRRSAIAIEAAQQRAAEDAILSANRDRDRIVLEARTREAAQAHAVADAERQRALAAQQAATAAQQAAAAAAQQVADTRQQALQAQQQAADSAQRSASLQQRASNAEAQVETLQQRTTAAEARALTLQQQLDEINARPTNRGLVVSLSDVLFDSGRSTLKPGAQRTMQRIADFMRDNPERRVSIEGFTDSMGDRSFNERLSRERAESVRLALITLGVAPERLTAAGYGPEYPIASNADPAGRQFNRRVEIVISDGQGLFSAR